MGLFFLCQLRAQCERIVAPRGDKDVLADFDAELGRLGPLHDVLGCETQMELFFEGPAKGEKWVPWHTVLCDHERYIYEDIYTLEGYADAEKFVLMFVFRGSSYIPLFNAIFMPILKAKGPDGGPTPLAKSLIWGVDGNRMSAYERGGYLHEAFMSYRSQYGEDGKPNKIHTSAYVYRPKQGESGDEYVYSLVRRAGEFGGLGHTVHNALTPGVKKDTVDGLLQGLSGVGPTMSKMFLVSTHLRYPHLALLDESCIVGDGAAAAFVHLFPTANKAADREVLLKKLLVEMQENISEIEPRLKHMMAWTAERTASAFERIIPKALFRGDDFVAFELQVNLCEWRKYRHMKGAYAGAATYIGDSSPMKSMSPVASPQPGAPSGAQPSLSAAAVASTASEPTASLPIAPSRVPVEEAAPLAPLAEASAVAEEAPAAAPVAESAESATPVAESVAPVVAVAPAPPLVEAANALTDVQPPLMSGAVAPIAQSMLYAPMGGHVPAVVTNFQQPVVPVAPHMAPVAPYGAIPYGTSNITPGISPGVYASGMPGGIYGGASGYNPQYLPDTPVNVNMSVPWAGGAVGADLSQTHLPISPMMWAMMQQMQHQPAHAPQGP